MHCKHGITTGDACNQCAEEQKRESGFTGAHGSAYVDMAIADYVAMLERQNKYLRKELHKNEARLKWLHDSGPNDAEGFEWGIYRVKWENGRAVQVWQTLSDLSDLDAEMARQLNTPNAPDEPHAKNL